jgi:chromate transporter
MILIELFTAFLYVGLFSIGGGYAAMPLIERQVVGHGWLTAAEFADIVTISQLTPGPVALNCASFVGTKLGGLAGAVVATLGCILPACILVAVIAALYSRYRENTVWAGALSGLRSAAVGMIFAAGLSLLIASVTTESAAAFGVAGKTLDPLAFVLFCAALFVLRQKKISPIAVMLLSGAAGMAGYIALGAVRS